MKNNETLTDRLIEQGNNIKVDDYQLYYDEKTGHCFKIYKDKNNRVTTSLIKREELWFEDDLVSPVTK